MQLPEIGSSAFSTVPTTTSPQQTPCIDCDGNELWNILGFSEIVMMQISDETVGGEGNRKRMWKPMKI